MGVLATFFRWFSENFLCSHLIGQKNCIFQPSRRRIYNLFTKFNSSPTYKDKNSAKYPLVKNIPHLYPWNRGFEYPFSKMFIVYLHSQAVCPPPHLVATGKRKVRPFFQKIISLTYMNKSGILEGCFEEWFTICLQKTSLQTKKRRRAHSRRGPGVFHPDLLSVLFILTQWQKEGFSHQLHSESEAVYCSNVNTSILTFYSLSWGVFLLWITPQFRNIRVRFEVFFFS